MTGTNIDLLERARAIQRKSIEFRENGIEVILPEKDFKAIYPRLALAKEMEGIFPDLVKEIEHLREQTDWQHENALKWKETCDELEDEKNQWKGRYLELNEDREQEMTDEDRKEIIDLDAELTAKDVEIERLRAMLSYPLAAFGTPELVGWIAEMQKLVDDTPESERGQIPFVMQMGALLERGMNSWQSSKIKELETRWHQKYEELYRITENYIKCLHKKEEECKRLEADFMKSHTIPIIKDGEYIRLHEKEAREELERIKEGGKNE